MKNSISKVVEKRLEELPLVQVEWINSLNLKRPGEVNLVIDVLLLGEIGYPEGINQQKSLRHLLARGIVKESKINGSLKYRLTYKEVPPKNVCTREIKLICEP